jgi:acyl-CoA dehydrogenase
VVNKIIHKSRYNGFFSPYYKETHIKFRQLMRKFVNEELLPYAEEWENSGSYPSDLHEKAYKAGVYGALWF